MKGKHFVYLIAVLIATGAAFYLHVWLVNFVDPRVGQIIVNGHYVIAHPPYNTVITATAGMTAILTICGILILFLLVEPKLANIHPLTQGVALAILVLLLDGQLVRQPLMNWLVGNPPDVVLLELMKVWIPRFAMCILVTSIVGWRRFMVQRPVAS